jgi:hypothetical protein
MAFYFLNMQTFSRSHGSSAPSLAAYRSGERIRDERTRRTYDHTDRQGVMHKEILLPARFAGADMSWATDRSALWNAAEIAEKRKDARVAREYLIACPASSLTRSGSMWCAASRRSSRSATDSPSTWRSTLRGISEEAIPGTSMRISWPRLARCPARVWEEKRRSISVTRIGESSGWDRASEELFYARQRWAEVANMALESAHVDARIDHRSLAAQGITREPKLWIPRIPYEIERRGGRSVVAEQIREDHRARHEPRHESRNARSPESRSPERDRNRARSEDIARQSIENWRQYRRERLESGERRAVGEDSAREVGAVST